MFDHIVPRERLLDHHQVEPVELLENIREFGDVGSVRVDHQANVRKLFTYRSDLFNVPARFDLDLDSPIALLQVTTDDLDKLFDTLLNSDTDSALDMSPCPAKHSA